MKKSLPYMDLFFFDLKLMDESTYPIHRQVNRLILKNFEG